jgi:GDPmannose 4,6-dehydratase
LKKAIITGVTGQDGSYLAELLLEKGYEVHGLIRRSSVNNFNRIQHFMDNPNFHSHIGELGDAGNITNLIKEIEPDEIYNLAAQSHVQASFESALFTADTDALGPLRILEAIRILGLTNKTRFYQASTSEMFGKVQEVPQRETTPFYPRSPYGVAKLYGHWITKNYRESYGMYACSGILFNHESPRRGENFVTSKIVLSLNNIKQGRQEVLELGNIDAFRDWGHAKDFVNAMWMMLQRDQPEDYVIATGEQHSVREFVVEAGRYYGMDIEWTGKGLDEVGIDLVSGKVVVRINPKFFRPAEVETLLGSSLKAHLQLGWKPEHTFDDLVNDMCENTPKIFPDYLGES